MGVKVVWDLVERTDLEPLANDVGPFPHVTFLKAWLNELGGNVEPLTVDWEEGQLMLMKTDSGLELLGEPDLTDYHCPLGTGIDKAVEPLVAEVGAGIEFSFDSLPMEAVDVLKTALEQTGLRPEATIHESAMVISLPDSVDDYYRQLPKRDRHELRRKRRRYEEMVGPVVLRQGRFDEFVRLHRMAAGTKGRFMTGPREAFFRRLNESPGWRVDYLEAATGSAAACLFGCRDEEGYYLYNSSYDPALQAASPGLVLISALIEDTIAEGLGLFDFLKGDEDYKSRLGAEPRPLYRLTGST